MSERAIVQVFERCHELEVVDIVPARWNPAQDLLLWQTVSTQYCCLHVCLLVLMNSTVLSTCYSHAVYMLSTWSRHLVSDSMCGIYGMPKVVGVESLAALLLGTEKLAVLCVVCLFPPAECFQAALHESRQYSE